MPVFVPVLLTELPAPDLISPRVRAPDGYVGESRSNLLVAHANRVLRGGFPFSELAGAELSEDEIEAYRHVAYLKPVAAAAWARFDLVPEDVRHWRRVGIRSASAAADLDDRGVSPEDYQKGRGVAYYGSRTLAQVMIGRHPLLRKKPIPESEVAALRTIGITRRTANRLRMRHEIAEVMAGFEEGLLPYFFSRWSLAQARELSAVGVAPAAADELFDAGVTDFDALIRFGRGEIPIEWACSFSAAEVVDGPAFGFLAA